MSRYTDRPLANQIAGKPIRNSCHLIMKRIKFQHSKTIKYSTCIKYMNSVCPDRDQSRLKQLELLFSIVIVSFRVISVLQSTEIEYQIFCDVQSLSNSYFGVLGV